MDDYFNNTYHLHQRHQDLMQERDHDRLVAIATMGQTGLLRELIRRWSNGSNRIVHHLIEAENCPDAKLAEPKSAT